MAVAELASPARRQVDAPRELQRASADGPTVHRRLVDQFVGLHVSVGEALTEAEESWRDEVFRGIEAPDRDSALRWPLTDWLGGATEMLARGREAHSENGPIVGLDELATAVAAVAAVDVRRVGWRPARRSAGCARFDSAQRRPRSWTGCSPPRPGPCLTAFGPRR